jgi:orotidine-5'-phosphate decarboxylase
VTVLTSLDDRTLREVGTDRPVLDHVLALARLAQAAGLQGVVASPQEIAAIRAACGGSFTIVTPGIRGSAAGGDRNDQARTMGPAEAIAAGATYIVVGRPIIAAPSPRAAADAIVDELRAGGAGKAGGAGEAGRA